MDRAREDFAAAGVDLVLIGQATSRHAAHFRRRQRIELPVLADERRVSYKAAGARMGGLGELLGPKVLTRGLATTLSTGKLQGRTIGNPAQLGGAAVLAAGGEVTWHKMASDASDNTPPAEILAAAREAVAG